jgi:hypothetical protein
MRRYIFKRIILKTSSLNTKIPPKNTKILPFFFPKKNKNPPKKYKKKPKKYKNGPPFSPTKNTKRISNNTKIPPKKQK